VGGFAVSNTPASMLGILSCVAMACSGSLPHARYMAQPSTALTAVALPPPPGRVELVPPSPVSGAVWTDGEWTFQHGRWAWRLGQWVVPPQGTFLSPWTTVRGADGTLFHAPSVWRDGKGQPITPPSPLAVATVHAGPVVDAEGLTEPTGRTMKPSRAAASPEPSPTPPVP
jgi:hypothetical protein